MNDLLTISEYSKIRGCSVSAVYKRLKSPSNRIHNFVVIQDDQTYLKAEIVAEEGLQAAGSTQPPPTDRQSKADPAAENRSNEVVEVEEGAVEEGIGAQAIRILEQQLLQKDKEIEDLNRRLDEAARHEREISLKMADLVAQANELQRNNQILLAQAKQQQIEPPPEQIQEEPEDQKKPGFWHRIFHPRRKEE